MSTIKTTEKKCNTLKLYVVTSPSLGPQSLVVKAHKSFQASQIAQDVIEENRWVTDPTYILYVTELIQPENNRLGYCYPSNSVFTKTVHTYTVYALNKSK